MKYLVFQTQNSVIWAILEPWMEGSLAPGDGSADRAKRALSPPLGAAVIQSLLLNVSAKNYKNINPCPRSLPCPPAGASALSQEHQHGELKPQTPFCLLGVSQGAEV